MSMPDELRRLELWLSKHRPEYLSTLGAGATPEALDEIERTIDARLPDAVRAWFSWRSGQARRIDTTAPGLVRDWQVLSSGDALRDWLLMKELFEGGDFQLHDWWRPGWFPLFARPQGDLIVVDLEGTLTEPGSIVEFWHDDPERHVHGPNLETWIGALVRSLEADLWHVRDGGSEWWERTDYEGLFERLLPAHVQTFDVSQEKPLAGPISTTTKEQWVRAFVDQVGEVTRSELWRQLPEGWATLRAEAGESLEDIASMVESAPPYTRTIEQGALATLAYERGLSNARELALAALEEDAPLALAEVVHRVGLADEAVRARAVARAERLATRPLSGAAALLFAVAFELGPYDAQRADAMARRARRITPMIGTSPTTKLEEVRRAAPPDRAARLRELLSDATTMGSLSRSCMRSLTRLAAECGLVEELAEAHPDGSISADLALEAFSVDASRGEQARSLVQDLETSTGHALKLRWARLAGDAEMRAEARAKLDEVDLQSEYREGLLLSTERAEIVVELARDAMDLGELARARTLLADFERMLREDIVGTLAAAASAVDQAEERPRKATRAELEALAHKWTDADVRKSSTRKLLLLVAEGEDGAFARSVLDRVIGAMTSEGQIPLADSLPRFEAALALALTAHGRIEEALELARRRWSRSEPRLLAQLIELLIERSRSAEAFTLGHHFGEMTELSDLLAFAPSLPRLVPESAPTVRAALEAATTWARGH